MEFKPSLLQSFVAPICRYTEKEGKVWVEEMHGTAFLASNEGHFLTAGHVLRYAHNAVEKKGGKIGVFPTQEINGKPTKLVIPVIDPEHAPTPHDIALFASIYKCETFFQFQNSSINVWQDVATLGYPISISHSLVDKLVVHQRGHSGYIQRKIPAGDLFNGNPEAFELNFSITEGMSGSPLFIHKGAYDQLIGVCVGTIESRIVLYEEAQVIEGEKELKEKVARVEEFGIAHSLQPLLEWKPKCLNGRKLIDLPGGVSKK